MQQQAFHDRENLRLRQVLTTQLVFVIVVL